LRRNIGRRGRCSGEYNAARAERKTALRHQQKPKAFKLTDTLKSEARDWLMMEKLSPELIAYKWKKRHCRSQS
jgi:IS30 family transposase